MKNNKIISLLLTIIITTVSILGSSNEYVQVHAASNEQIIYNFLTSEMGLNTAAACGVLANIEKESGFVNDRLEIGYTWGSGGGYGICQWTNTPRKSSTGRRTNLVNWCTSNGYDYKSLIGQLYFLKHELETDVRPGVYKYLKNVSNTADGTYNAGYKWCYSFETPAGYNTGVSEARGNYAKNTYWPRYNNNHVDTLEIDPYYAPYTPIIAYINTTSNAITYSSDCSSSIGYIESGDKCIIQEIYTNGWCKAQYPISNGTKIGYLPVTAFLCNNSKSFKQMTADRNSDTFSRSDLKSRIGSIYQNDVCYIVGASGSSSQAIYPTDSGNKLGWTSSSVWSSPPTGYNISVSATSMYVGEQIQIYITPFDNNVTGYKFFALKPNGETASKDLGSSNGANFKPPTAGVYKIYAAVYNEYGEFKGSETNGCIEVTVREKGSAPTGYNISVSSTSMYLGEQIQIYINPYDNDVTGYKFFALKPNGETVSKDLGSSNGANFKPPTAGKYKIYAAVYNDYGEYKGSVTDGCVEVEVIEKEAPSLSFSTKTVNLDLAGANSATVNITAKGNLPSPYHFNCNRDTSAMSTKWGDWSGSTSPLTISGLKTGTYTIKVSLIDGSADEDVYMDTITVNIICSHKYSSKVTAPTCTEKGYTTHICSICDESYKDSYVEAKGHNYGSWTITQEATCTKNGTKMRECSKCETIQLETISAKHRYKDTVVSPTYLQKGYTNHTCMECNKSNNDTFTNYANKVVVADIVLMQNYLVKRVDLDSEQWKQADMNKDGKVNVFDDIIMKRKILN